MNFENVSRVFPFPMRVLTSGILSIPLSYQISSSYLFEFSKLTMILFTIKTRIWTKLFPFLWSRMCLIECNYLPNFPRRRLN